jgi:AcrR family transcriptional regulator
MNDKLFLRDPESTELGKKIVRQSILLINQMGFEDFTFKKLANAIQTTEAGVYRYFENKHRLLVYLITWYWNLLEFQVMFQINNLTDPERKIKKVVELLSTELPTESGVADVDARALYQVVIAESNKVYLTKEVTADNQAHFFKPYKDLCARIAGLISEFNPTYPFPHSLASTLVEMAHIQYFFMHNLPSLTDFGHQKDPASLRAFLETLVFSNIREGK